MRKLISMTDFVLQVVQTPNINEAICWEQIEERLNKIYEYSLFLKQPLNLGMFVPCDLEGNVLNIPEYWGKFNNEISHFKNHPDCLIYNEAKERVLFEGFEIKSFHNSERKTISFESLFHVFWLDYGKWNLSFGIKTIEDLVKYNLTLKV